MRLLFVGLALFVLGALGLVFQQVMDPTFLGNFPKMVQSSFIQPLSEEEYTKTYKQAVEAMSDKMEDWEQVKNSLERLKNQEHPLQPIVLLTLAKAYSFLNQEGAAQDNLNTLATRYRLSAFYTLAKYQLGQSYVRVGQKDRAKTIFIEVIEKAPESQMAIGSHYYLGEIAMANQHPEEASKHWQAYIQKSPGGSFSNLCVQGLQKLKVPLNAQLQESIGRVYLANEDPINAQKHLEKSTMQTAWLPLAKALIKQEKPEIAKSILLKGLQVSTNKGDSEEGLNSLLALQSDKNNLLKTLMPMSLPYAKDKVLWELSERSSGAEAIKYQDMLLKSFPKSDWAPETSWKKQFRFLQKGDMKTFLALASNHIKLYPQSKSMPRVLFWRAKIHLKNGQKSLANADLDSLIQAYPGHYYAYRAAQIEEGIQNPWVISSSERFPSEPEVPNKRISAQEWKSLKAHLPPDLAVSECALGLVQAKDPKNLQFLIEAYQDIQSKQPLLDETPEKYVLLALIGQASDNHYASIKAMDKLVETAYKTKNTTILKNLESTLSQLTYPNVYQKEVSQAAQKNQVSPFLINALIRQESAFNPVAISSSKAMGLMQLLPSTAQEVAKTEKLSGFNASQLFSPDVNIRLGTSYIRYLQQLFAGNTMKNTLGQMYAIGAYNGGPGSMKRWLASLDTADPDWFIESIPYDQTRDYIKSVYAHYWNYKKHYN